MFNQQDITQEADMWTEAYISGDFKTLGFVFADTLDKHSIVRKQKPRFILWIEWKSTNFADFANFNNKV